MKAASPLRVFAALTGFAGISLSVFLFARHPEAIPAAIWVFIIAVLVIAASLFEGSHYKPIATHPPVGSVATAERFIDPATNKLIDVYFNPATGERTYVAVTENQ